MARRVPYALAVHGQEELDAVTEVINSHKTIMGEKVREFETRVAALFAKKHGIMVNSGSSANLVAIEVMNLPPGSEVITPAMTFSTTVAPLIQKGLVPVYTDAVEGSYLLDIDQVEELITEKTRLLMVPSLLGNIPDYVRLQQIAKAHNLLLLEDSCDTLGPTIDGKSTGTYTDISTTSFYGSHIITAGGGGGMVSLNNDDWKREAYVLRGWGRSSAADETEDIDTRFGFVLDGEPHDSKFIFEKLGYNFLPSEMGAAFGIAQVKKLPEFMTTRQRNFADFLEFFKQYEEYFILPKQAANVKTAWLAFPLTVREGAPFNRMELMKYLEKHDVQTRPTFSGNLLRHPGFKNQQSRVRPGGYPVADYIMRHAFLIGCHHGMTAEDTAYVKQLFTDFINAKKKS
ncbi:MAG: aminotransferase class I/II-fold pyridoxal phosphate-dependent enzyme [Candidatus Kerfeldbacteria bacterium]|nr:aminotransferase class I/II-fold pyridoxal phosphate-dependent enzyme [Candidatus Kerfeldbacteria bacterium]